MADVVLIRRFCFFLFSLQYFFNPGNTHLVIYVSQQSGQDTSNCLRNDTAEDTAISCKSLGYALNNITTDNETFVDIIFKDQVYHVKELLVIDLPEERNLRLRISSGLERKSNISLICSNYSTGIFEVNGPNLNLEFHHITFEKCINVKTVIPVIVVNNTKSISIFSCTFQNNWSTGLFAINSAVRIENCKFENNSVDNVNRSCGKICSISYVLGGAVGILFNNEKRNMSVDIFHSHFIQNSVHVNNERYYVANKDPNNVTVRGGAIHITLGGKTSFLNTVRINECQFERNFATLGGALHIQLLDNSMNNSIEITASKFLSNYGAQVGGAFIMSLWDQSAKTTLTMTDVLIEKNWSKSGSGIYIFLKSQGIVSDISGKQPFLFRRVHLHNNAGPTGSAVKVVSPLFGRRPIRVIPVFEDCTFVNNTNVPFNNYGYMPSFIADRVDINFTGTNVFYGNKYFGAALFSSSLVHVHGKLHFIGNNGNKGGALYLENSQIILHPGTNVLFQNNHADFFGGAINVVSNANIYHVAVVNNPECFITYSEKDVSQNNWNTSIHFINNTAALKGPAINIDSLILCSWDQDSQSINFKKSLKWKSSFFYEGNVVCQDNNFLQCQQSNGTINNHDVISTDVASLVEKNGVKNLEICPGEAAFLDIAAYDELDKPVFTLINDLSPNTSGLNTEWLVFKPQLYIVQPQEGTQVEFQYTLNGKFKPQSNASAKLYFYDLSNPPVYVEFTIVQNTCRPGFLQKDNTCVCDKSKTGVIGCSADGHYVQIKGGYWAGLVDNKFTVMPCPFGYCKCPKRPNTTAEISGCSFRSVNYDDSLVCANNRHGYLCGKCQKNFTVGIQSFKCVPDKKNATCTWTSIISVLLTMLICALVLYCNPGLDNEFRGPLFFFQVLPIFFPLVTYSTTHETEIYNLVFFISSIFDFTIPFFSYFISDCYLIDGVDNLTMLAFGYSSSVLAFLVSFVAFILSCQRKILIRRKNAVQCFWVLLIFMYTSLIKTSLRILDCPPIQGKLRLFAQASVICYQDDHLAMAVFAIIIMVFCGLIIPLLIIVMTASSFFRFDPHYVDTLTNKLKPECLWWWAVDLLRRLLVVILDVYIPFWNHKQVSLVFASVVILSIHCYFQPYQQRRANITEAIFLLVLCGVAAFQLLDISDEEQGKMNMGIVCVMFSYSALVVICKLVALIIKRKTSSIPNIMDYENLEETEPTTTVTTINYEESVEERKEKIDALFSRSLTASVNHDSKPESNHRI